MSDEIARLIKKNEQQADELDRLTAEVEHWKKLSHDAYWKQVKKLTAENERIEKEAACAAHNADKYHDIIREQRAKVERLTAENERLREREKMSYERVLQAKVERLEAVLKDIDRWLAVFVAAWDKSRDKKKPSEAPVALMEAIRQHSLVRAALQESE